MKKPVLLIVLDGWGHAAAGPDNAITAAPAHNFLRWQEEWPSTLLSASGREVGLPLGLMGNSEVGHTNIGAGRLVYQSVTRIDASIDSGEFERNAALRGAIDHARSHGSKLHLWGLLGNGGVHSSDHHYAALLKLAKEMGLPSEQILFHALLDGRDTPPSSSPGYLRALEAMFVEHGGRLASVCGRYWGMDRDQNGERTQRFWDVFIHARAPYAAGSGVEAVTAAMERGETDEFLQPTTIGPRSPVADNDAILCFNYRADRVRQISDALLNPDFVGFERGELPKLHYATMTQYRKDYACPVAYPPEELRSLFGELVSAKGLRQFRCAETEKYAHVTFFFNGGREEIYPGEDRVLVPSPKVATYDLKPEMSAPQVADQVCMRLEKNEHDLYVVNFANPDMVGHTGIESAAEAAVRSVDECLGRIVKLATAHGGTVAITADHGNCEMMRDPVTGEKHTAHTVNPVPLVLIGEDFRGARLREMGTLADVAPTLMEVLGVEQPPCMDGVRLQSR